MAADQAIAACGGDARNAVKALLVTNEFLEAQIAELQAAVSNGYRRVARHADLTRQVRPDCRTGQAQLDETFDHVRRFAV
jgi:hypothetical protein